MNTIRAGIRNFIFALALAGAAGGVAAKETPADLSGVTLVNAERVQSMMKSGVPVYDVRVAAEYAEAHIKGAKSLPYREKSAKEAGFDKTLDGFDIDKLGTDRNAVIIFYCNAGDCWKSYKASKVAADAGFKRVHWYRGGIPDWRSKGLPIE
jgi:rhodanese-related sulfurtransferase